MQNVRSEGCSRATGSREAGPRSLRVALKESQQVTPVELRKRTEELAKKNGQLDLFELLFEEASAPAIKTLEEFIALYTGQWTAFQNARAKTLYNTSSFPINWYWTLLLR